MEKISHHPTFNVILIPLILKLQISAGIAEKISSWKRTWRFHYNGSKGICPYSPSNIHTKCMQRLILEGQGMERKWLNTSTWGCTQHESSGRNLANSDEFWITCRIGNQNNSNNDLERKTLSSSSSFLYFIHLNWLLFLSRPTHSSLSQLKTNLPLPLKSKFSLFLSSLPLFSSLTTACWILLPPLHENHPCNGLSVIS